eukprot:TRINITY_DN6598_c0_g1_i1.p1 TRINITY_DN6598_c0_g1~~TRINITY_DN6598_c0_g1_i1.p1  ORF type:complete len:305 (+),score=49.80 TRINITY_DN6598_c0_g1_i1:214-1128(+)
MADRKDIPRLNFGQGQGDFQTLERAGVDFQAPVVYRWPSCSYLSDSLFRNSAICNVNARWMFFALTGHDANTAQPAHGLVRMTGTWRERLDQFRRTIDSHNHRAFHFVENGITNPFHAWVVVQIPTPDQTASTFEVICSFANSWRVIDWLNARTQPTGLPLPAYAGAAMSRDQFNVFLDNLETLYTEWETGYAQRAPKTLGVMSEAAKTAYRYLWTIDAWKTLNQPATLAIQYAASTPKICSEWSRYFIQTYGIPNDPAWNGAPTVINFPRREAETRLNEWLEKNPTSTQVDKDRCRDDLNEMA